jgi:hypothetical protein
VRLGVINYPQKLQLNVNYQQLPAGRLSIIVSRSVTGNVMCIMLTEYKITLHYNHITFGTFAAIDETTKNNTVNNQPRVAVP